MPMPTDIRLSAVSHDIAGSAGQDTGFFQGVGDWVTKGVPAAVVSGVYQLKNSAMAIGSLAGWGDNEQVDIAERMDDILGLGVGDYYRAHQSGADFGGFLLGSIVPGGAGVKLLKAGQAGLAALKAAELGQVGSNMSLALRVMTGTQQKALLDAAKVGMETGGLAWKQTFKTRLQAIAAGSFQTGLEFTAAETLTQAALNQSPIYAELNDPKDWAFNALIAGGIGSTGHLILNPLVLAFGGGKLTAMKELYATRDALDSAVAARSVANGNLEAARERGTRLVGNIIDLRNPPEVPDSPNFKQQAAEAATARERALTARAVKNITEMLDPKSNIIPEDVLTLAKTAPQESVNALFVDVSKMKNIAVDDFDKVDSLQFYMGPKGDIRTSASAFGKDDKLGYLTFKAEEIAPTTVKNPEAAWNAGYKAMIADDGTVMLRPGTKPPKLYAEPQLIESIFDSTTGMIVTRPVGARIADFGKAQLLRDGQVVRGDGAVIKPYNGSFGPELINEAPDLEAIEARYYWERRQKVNTKKDVDSSDLPRLEHVIQSAPVEQDEFLINGSKYTREQAVNLLQDRKEAFIERLMQLSPDVNPDRIATATYSDLRAMMASEDYSRKELLKLLEVPDDKPRFWKLENTVTRPHDRFELLGNNQVMERYKHLKEEGRQVLAAVFGDEFTGVPEGLNAYEVAASRRSAAGAANFQDATYLSPEAKGRQIGEKSLTVAQNQISDASTALDATRTSIVNKGAASAENLEGSWILAHIRDNKEDMIWRAEEGVLKSKALLKEEARLEEALAAGRPATQIQAKIEALSKSKVHLYKVQSPEVGAYLSRLVEQQNRIMEKSTIVGNFFGKNTEFWAPNQLMVPPVDIGKRPFVAFVSRTEGSIGYDGEVAVVTARDAQELQQKMRAIKEAHPDWIVKDKQAVEDFFVAKATYDYAQSMTSYSINSTLRREGHLVGNIGPRANFDWINEFEIALAKQITSNVRGAVRAQYAREIAELELRAYEEIAQQQSATGYKRFGPLSAKTPYTDVINNMLFINPASVEDNIWNALNRKAEEVLGSGLQKTGELWDRIVKKELTPEQARGTLDMLGYDQAIAKTISENVYKSELQSPAGRKLVAGINNVMSFFMLRADYWQPFVNAMSLPILANPVYKTMLDSVTRKGLAHDGFASVAGVKVPGGDLTQLSGVKVAARANKRMWDNAAPAPDSYLVTEGLMKPGESYKDFFIRQGILPTEFSYVHTVLDTAADMRTGGLEALAARHTKVMKGFEKVRKVLTWPSDFAEKYTRYISADMAMQLAESVKVPVNEIPGFISLAVAQMNGQYRAFQRPQAFQGIIGQTLSLFQSYQFNFIQRYLRFMEAGDNKAMLMMAALQTGIYGLRGMPYFDVMNRHFVGERNAEHADIYTGVYSLVDKEIGDFIAYGAGSALTGAGIHTRGDVTPRNAFILPTSPTELPQVAIVTNTINAMGNFISKVEGGAGVLPAMLQALEHNGMSRPLQGAATLAQGFTTTRQGNFQANNADQGGRGVFGGDGWYAQRLADLTRLMGSRPLSESIYLDTAYRYQTYQRADANARNALGNALTLRIADLAAEGKTPDIEVMKEFMQKYTEAGGNLKSFKAWWFRNIKNAETRRADILAEQFANDEVAKNMQLIMGADPSTPLGALQ